MIRRFSPPGLPSAPTDLVAVAVGRYQVLLAWDEGAGGPFGVRVERAAGNDPCKRFLDIGGVAPHVTAFRDGSIKPRAAYFYRVHAWNASGDSSSSNVAEVTLLQAGKDLLPD